MNHPNTERGLRDEDICQCGDYRRDHINGGRCKFNGPGFDLCHAGEQCFSFRLATPTEEQL